MRRCSVLGLLVLCLVVTGCARYPLDMTEAEWNAMSADQRYAARLKQAELDAAAQQRKAEKEAHEQALQLAAKKRQQTLIAQRRSNPSYGDIVQCVIKSPMVDFHPGWRKAESVAFSLVRSETSRVSLRAEDSRRTSEFWAYFDENGSTLRLCERNPGRSNFRDCDVVPVLGRDLMTGVDHQIDLPNLMQGVLRCAYGPGTGGPHQIIFMK